MALKAEYEAERARIRGRRVGVLKRYLRSLRYQVGLLPAKEGDIDGRTETSPTYTELTSGIKMCVDQLRLEYRALEPAGLADTSGETPQVEEHNPLKGLRIHRAG